jgi:hypothetical protein
VWYAEDGTEFTAEYTGHGGVGCLCLGKVSMDLKDEEETLQSA